MWAADRWNTLPDVARRMDASVVGLRQAEGLLRSSGA